MDEASEVERAQAMLQMQTLLSGQKATMKILGQCFEKCVDEPGNELAFKDQQCIWNCTQRLLDTEHFLMKRLQGVQKKAR
mmetsp:Transcript_33020/g.77183  ORF Transcript_33020/g.77183 Transcript_33020/m.77183 type:complete len:80 (-) Transcript_33020:91-330(-)